MTIAIMNTAALRRQSKRLVLLACLAVLSKLLLSGQQLCGYLDRSGTTTTYQPHDVLKAVDPSQSQCPDVPQAPVNVTRIATTATTTTTFFDRPPALEELLSTPTMKMPSAHNITGLRIALVGDSVTRYQMVTLAFYLRFGQWISDDAVPNMLAHPTFKSWDHVSNYSVNLFGESSFPCDCFGPNKTLDNVFYDNRYYRDKCRDNSISYISKLGTQATKGHWHPEENFTDGSSVFDRTILNAPTPVWTFDTWPDLLRQYITRLTPKPDYLVMNEGLWAKHDFLGIVDERNGTTIFHEIRRILDEHGIHGIYKTTTMAIKQKQTKLLPHDAVGCKVLHSCLQMNWTAHVNGPGHYIDRLHFRPHMNRFFVEQLWDHLAQLENERQQVIATPL